MGTRIIGLAAVLAFSVLVPTLALAQPAATGPFWDVAITAGSINGESTGGPEPGYGDDWHHAAEWRLSAGRYWTPHLKSEVELGTTGEGERYTQRLITAPGSATRYPYTAQQFVRVRQGSARVTWQFLDNQWVHPYLSAGVSMDEERTRTHVYAPVFAPDPRNPATRVVVGTAEHDEPQRTIHRAGLVIGGGAKCYVSPSVFIKTGAQVTLSRPARSISFVAGMGIDF